MFPSVFKGSLRINEQKRIGIVVARFNEMITKSLLEGALEGFEQHGIEREEIDTAWVPGAFEIPLVAKKMAQSGRYHAIVTLGAVIRGATAHFDYVAGPVASQIASLATEMELPIIFGVLTTDTIEQAIERAGTKCGNKGHEAALAALEMLSLMEQLPAGQRLAGASL